MGIKREPRRLVGRRTRGTPGDPGSSVRRTSPPSVQLPLPLPSSSVAFASPPCPCLSGKRWASESRKCLRRCPCRSLCLYVCPCSCRCPCPWRFVLALPSALRLCLRRCLQQAPIPLPSALPRTASLGPASLFLLCVEPPLVRRKGRRAPRNRLVGTNWELSANLVD